jgi:hypothetical protein
MGERTHGVLNLIDDGLTSCFNAEIVAHISHMICSCASSDNTIGIHDFTKSIAFDQEMIMARLIIKLTYYSTRNGRDALLSVRPENEVP